MKLPQPSYISENGFSNHSVFSLMSLKFMNFVQIEKQVYEP
jgi:hypothetical protein